MTRNDGCRFTESWIDAWNAFDVERVLALFTEDATFVSPKAAVLAGRARLEGKDAMRRYWMTAKEKIRSLRFAQDHVVFDPETRELVIVYEATIDGERKRACELFRFDDDGRATAGEAMYGAPL